MSPREIEETTSLSQFSSVCELNRMELRTAVDQGFWKPENVNEMSVMSFRSKP